jgi:hypothetical protein
MQKNTLAQPCTVSPARTLRPMEASLPPPQCLTVARSTHCVGPGRRPCAVAIEELRHRFPALLVSPRHRPSATTGRRRRAPAGIDAGTSPSAAADPRRSASDAGPTHWCLGHNAIATALTVGPRGGMMALLSSMVAPLPSSSAPEEAHPPSATAPFRFSTPKKNLILSPLISFPF